MKPVLSKSWEHLLSAAAAITALTVVQASGHGSAQVVEALLVLCATASGVGIIRGGK